MYGHDFFLPLFYFFPWGWQSKSMAERQETLHLQKICGRELWSRVSLMIFCNEGKMLLCCCYFQSRRVLVWVWTLRTLKIISCSPERITKRDRSSTPLLWKRFQTNSCSKAGQSRVAWNDFFYFLMHNKLWNKLLALAAIFHKWNWDNYKNS